MHKKTIIFLDQYPNLSGGQKVLFNIILAFFKKGYRPIAVLPAEGLLSEKLKEIGIEVRFFPLGYYNITKKNLWDLINFFFRIPALTFLLIKLIRQNDADLVYANGARTFIWATIACCIAKKPLFWHIHSIFTSPSSRLPILIFGKSSVVKKIFVVSNSAIEPIKSLGAKLKLMYNAISVPEINRKRDFLKDEFNLAKDSFLVGAIGMLEEWKNQQDLIFAAKKIKDSKRMNIVFFIVGDSLYSSPSKQIYKNRLKKLVADMELEKNIIFTGFRSDADNIMSSLDIMVISSKDPDPCPLVSLEAASLGLPIISTDFGGTKEIFSQNNEALFYKAGDSADLTNKIIYLLENPEKLALLSNAARAKIKEEHNLDNYSENLIKTVEEAVYGN